MILLCETIILSMMDLTTVHTVIRFSRKVETGLSTQLPSCGTVANIAFQYKNCNEVPVGRKRVPFQHLNRMLFVSCKTFL